jgi:hypothetical protein
VDDSLVGSVSDLMGKAAAVARTPAWRADLESAQDRLTGPLRVAIAGRVKAGKSTLLNALLGEELAATDAGECTKIVTWYQQGDERLVTVHPHGSEPRPAMFSQSDSLTIDLADLDPADVERIVVSWPSRRLRNQVIIDTPGIASISTEISERTLRVLTPEDDRAPVVDAVIYLLRHTHASDVRFLESFHDDELTHGTPMNAVGVLSRADEIGSCRLDAMETAERVAGRYGREPRLRRLCPVILPVAGLLALAGRTLREVEFRSLQLLSRADADEVAELLLTADRFDHRVSTVPITELERQHLQSRLGLFGVRLAVELIRDGTAGDTGTLAAELVRRSGFDNLQAILGRQFTERSAVLKARSALAVLGTVLRSDGCREPERLGALAEQVTVGAHAFEEMRLLDLLRSNDIPLRPDRLEELDRLFGGFGHGAAIRLGLNANADERDIEETATAALRRWRAVAEHPLSTRVVQRAAQAAQRTLEGMLG